MSPTRPCVVKVFEPFSTQQSPSRAAVVRMPAASLPEVDSVSPHAPSLFAARERRQVLLLLRFGAEQEDVRGTQPVVRRDRQRHAGIDARQLLDADAVVDGATSRRRRTAPETECRAARAPPACGSSSAGKCCASSHSRTCGRISVSANSRTLRRSSSCSSVSRKSSNSTSVSRGRGGISGGRQNEMGAARPSA